MNLYDILFYLSQAAREWLIANPNSTNATNVSKAYTEAQQIFRERKWS